MCRRLIFQILLIQEPVSLVLLSFILFLFPGLWILRPVFLSPFLQMECLPVCVGVWFLTARSSFSPFHNLAWRECSWSWDLQSSSIVWWSISVATSCKVRVCVQAGAMVSVLCIRGRSSFMGSWGWGLTQNGNSLFHLQCGTQSCCQILRRSSSCVSTTFRRHHGGWNPCLSPWPFRDCIHDLALCHPISKVHHHSGEGEEVVHSFYFFFCLEWQLYSPYPSTPPSKQSMHNVFRVIVLRCLCASSGFAKSRSG